MYSGLWATVTNITISIKQGFVNVSNVGLHCEVKGKLCHAAAGHRLGTYFPIYVMHTRSIFL